jgi:hypothetical protein
MIHTCEDFYNKVSGEIRAAYFAEVKYYRDNDSCAKAIYALELFNNGCLNYRKLVGRLAKACNATTAAIHNLVSKYVVSFGQYQYKPKTR